ncbi:MAG: acyl carrier protein [Rubrivivax sp.]|jgi:acyl carrier protein|nr:acyl carrier protein [Rubrivivax sp.]
MQSKQDILAQLINLLEELFEIDPATISLESSLYDELDIDSIDAVDMAVRLNEITGRKLQPSEFKELRTVGDVVDAVYRLLQTATVTAQQPA